jgi:RNA recognition motif-containing protein
MTGLAHALPHSNQGSLPPTASYGGADAFNAPMRHHGQQSIPPMMGRPGQFDPASLARMQQQQQQFAAPYGPYSPGATMMGGPGAQYQQQGQYPQFDPYAYGMNNMQMPTFDPRTVPGGQYAMPLQSTNDPGSANVRTEPAPIPSYPRGPPRKPKQSGHALWVGNLPPNATVMDLKDHFSRDATEDIESLFLISKSNCAFVNYRSEAACIGAMNRFHDSRFNGVRLVCRLRRGSTASTPTSAVGPIETPESPSIDVPIQQPTPTQADEPSSPTIVGGTASTTARSIIDDPQSSVDARSQRLAERFFVVKSLTVQDLEASVRKGTWATQSHNEKVLNEAYENADNVYLIFSANKSGEYFGYARMSSTISGEPVNLSSTFQQSEPSSSGTPQSIPTPATATAPKGRIIDDSARGTIFWEAERSDDNDDEGSPVKGEGEVAGNSNWGRQFNIEWLSTNRLPFYRTRGLRNPWK